MCGAESWLKGKGRCLLKHNLPFWSNNDKKQCHGNETEATQPASISEPNTLKALPPRLPEAGWDLPCAALPCLLCFPQGCVAKQGAPGLNNACGTTYAFCRTRWVPGRILRCQQHPSSASLHHGGPKSCVAAPQVAKQSKGKIRHKLCNLQMICVPASL